MNNKVDTNFSLIILLLFLINFSLLNASTSDTASTSTATERTATTTSEATPEKQIQPLSLLRICINNIAKRAHNRHCGRKHWKKLPEELLESLIKAHSELAKAIYTLAGHAGLVSSVLFNAKGDKIFSGSSDGTVRIWDVQTKQEVAKFMVEIPVRSISLNPAETNVCIVFLNQRIVTLLDIRANKTTELNHSGFVSQAKFSPDGKKIYLGDKSGVVHVYKARTRKKIKELKGHSDWITSILFSPDGKMVCSASEDKTVGLWNLKTGKLIKKLTHESEVLSAGFSPDSSKICSATKSCVKLWNIKTEKEIANFQVDHRVYSLLFSPDGTMIKIMTAQDIKFLNVENLEEIASLPDNDMLYSAAFSPNGTMICTGDWNMKVKLWGVPSE